MMYALKSRCFGGVWVSADEHGNPWLTANRLDADCLLTAQQVKDALEVHRMPSRLGNLQLVQFAQM